MSWENKDYDGLYYHSPDGEEIIFEYKDSDYLKTNTKDLLKQSNRSRFFYVIQDSENCYGLYKIVLNTGETKDDFICSSGLITRYKSEKGNTNERRVLGVWMTNHTDTQIRNLLMEKHIKGVAPVPDRHTPEFITIDSPEALSDVLDAIPHIIKELDGSVVKSKVEKHVFKDILDDIHEVLGKLSGLFLSCTMRIAPIILASLPPRYGKTIFAILLWLFGTKAKFLIIMYYVGTVKNSFFSTIDESKGFERVKTVDLTYKLSNDDFDEILEFSKEPDNRLLIALPITGEDETFDKRMNQILPFLEENVKNGANYCMVIDEADYGAHCKKQREKIRKLNSVAGTLPVWRMAMSGTGIEKAEKIWDDRKVDISLDINDVEMSYRVNRRKNEEK